MILMPGNHCAEHIKEATETIINSYDFDLQNKLYVKFFFYEIFIFQGVSSDEGSAYVRLFKQIHIESDESGDQDCDGHEAMYVEDDVLMNCYQSEEVIDDLASVVNSQIRELAKESYHMPFENVITVASFEQDEIVPNDLIFDEDEEYDFSKNDYRAGELYTKFEIKLGTSEVPRISCANHKCNIAVRLAT